MSHHANLAYSLKALSAATCALRDRPRGAPLEPLLGPMDEALQMLATTLVLLGHAEHLENACRHYAEYAAKPSSDANVTLLVACVASVLDGSQRSGEALCQLAAFVRIRLHQAAAMAAFEKAGRMGEVLKYKVQEYNQGPYEE